MSGEQRWEIKDGQVVQLEHPAQIRLMELATKLDIRTLSLRQIAKITGINNPASVKYHIAQIAKTGFDFSEQVGLIEQGEQNE